MKIFISNLLLALLAFVCIPMNVEADQGLDYYLDAFYEQSNEASQILKDIENDLKNGSREKVCSRQSEAAKLGLLANKSLIKAFELNGTEPPIEAITASQEKWRYLLNQCKNK